jgi:hypothetical protein
VEADEKVLARWPGLSERVRAAFDAREDVDACARVKLSMRRAAIAVDVMLPDGRSASRAVSRQEDVVPMLEALLLVPPSPEEPPPLSSGPGADAEASTSPPDAPTSVPEPGPKAREVPMALNASTPNRDASRPSSDARARFGVELSVLTGARVGDGTTSIGLGAGSLVELFGWLGGLRARADRYGIAGGPQGAVLEVAALVGRRFRFDGISLDLIGGPAIAWQGITSESDVPAGPEGHAVAHTRETSGSVPRLVLGSRVTFQPRSVLRTFLGVDADVGPTKAGGPLPSEALQLPVWTVGLAFGATVGTL